MKYSRQWAMDRYNAGKTIAILSFWGHKSDKDTVTKSCFSQWYDCYFELDGVRYHTAEQYMMAQKALLFGDQAVYEKIMATDNPSQFKKLGRAVHPFDACTWETHKYDIVLRGNIGKFSQNPPLGDYLCSTGESILVEASPYDHIWGVKLRTGDARIENPNLWLGANLLGFALMETRDILRERAAGQ